ncbi:beta-ketoacyl-ACP synthase [Halioglobus sp.]|nr:beta-ketoacyl-ACP synthase [Halioglobus sp.]
MRRRVAITGGGSISSLGSSWETVRMMLRAGESSVSYMTDWDKYYDMHTRIAAPVANFYLPDHYTSKQVRNMGRVAQLAVLATENALEQSGLRDDSILSSGQAGVAYGSAMGSADAGLEFLHLLESKSVSKVKSTSSLRFMSHSAAMNISVIFGTCGRMYTTSSACTSGSQGIGYAMEAIRSGTQIIMIAGGAEELSAPQAATFEALYSASSRNEKPEMASRPFDKNRDGLVLGEGACTLILEDWDSAAQRGAKVLAELVGFGTNTDGNNLLRPDPKSIGIAMELALADAGLASKDIGYISGHGTSTIYGDISETIATHAVMGASIPFSSLKGNMGHGLGLCGAFEAWASINMMNESWFPPTLNLENIDKRCAELDYIRDGVREFEAEYFMSNNFAFGGVNTSLIFKRS